MSNSTPPLLQGITDAMRYLSDRQKVIAQNVANSETPGYKTRDVEKPDFSSMLSAQQGGSHRVARPQVSLTSGMAALGATQPAAGHVILNHDVSETKPDGNNVTIEDQLLQLGEVQADFATLTSLYRKQMGLLKIALGRGGTAA